MQFFPWGWLRDVRGGQFVPERDFDELIQIINRWRHKNGLLWPMPTRFWGRQGPMTEILGILAPLQEMMLQSWEKNIRIFPVWPKNVNAEFEKLRAEGAFLVSAAHKDGNTENVVIESLIGTRCSLINPWPDLVVQITLEGTDEIILEEKADNLIFDTHKGKIYRIEPLDK